MVQANYFHCCPHFNFGEVVNKTAPATKTDYIMSNNTKDNEFLYSFNHVHIIISRPSLEVRNAAQVFMQVYFKINKLGPSIAMLVIEVLGVNHIL